MENNPLKYSDLIKDDGAIQAAIDQLELLEKAYTDLNSTVKSHATETKQSIQLISGATEDGRKTTSKAIADTARLEAAQRELAFAMSEVGAQVAELKMRTNEQNKATRESAAYVHATSRSYNEFKAELTLLTNQYRAMTKEQALNSAEGTNLINKIISLRNSIKSLDDATKSATTTQRQAAAANKAAAGTVSELEKAKLKLAQATSAETAQLLELMMQTKEANTIAKLNVIVSTEQAGSYNALSAQYALNKIALNKMTVAERENTEAGRAMVTNTNNMYAEMIRLQEVTGKHALSVGNYRKTWDGLGHSVTQVVRELPALAINFQTLALALSNNIPILKDEIDLMKKHNELLVKDGKEPISVWKQIAKSILSVNTALILGITILTIWGQKILDWASKIVFTRQELLKLSEVTKNIQASAVKGREDAQAELTHLKLLYSATQNHSKSLSTRLKAVAELRKLYPTYLDNLSDEEILVGKAANAYTTLAGAILKAAKARAAEETIVENEKQILKLKDLQIGYTVQQIQLNKKLADARNTAAMAASGTEVASSTLVPGATPITQELAIDKLSGSLADVDLNAKKAANSIYVLEEANKRLAASIDTNDILAKPDKTGKTPKGPKDRTEEILAANLAIRKRYEQSITDLQEDEIVKRAQDLEDAYAAEARSLLNKYDNDKDLTLESRDYILAIIENMQTALGYALADLDNEILARRLANQEETLQLMLEATEEGSREEANIRLQMIENQRQQELVANRLRIESLRQDEAAINAKYDQLYKDERIKSAYEIHMAEYDLMAEYYQSEFDVVKQNEKDITKFKLQAEKARWLEILKLAKAGNTKLTDIEIQTIENYIKAIDRKLNESDKFNIYEALGLKVSDEEQKAVAEAINIAMGYLREALDSEIAMKDLAIKKSEDRLAARQNELDAEITARNNGYAFNVVDAQRQVALEKDKLAKLQEQKADLVKKQQALDAISQASSLVTATANIWASYSSMGPFGIALAIAATTAMWGAFGLAKIKAAQLTTQEAKLYGEGGFEILEGGSHASGNDINIGNTRDGRQRRAEGGEGLAIIRKSRMAKYKNILPGIVESLNKGTFENRYADMFSNDNFDMNINTTNTDLRALESDVRKIREQGELRTRLNGRGQEVVEYKNLKTTYLS